MLGCSCWLLVPKQKKIQNVCKTDDDYADDSCNGNHSDHIVPIPIPVPVPVRLVSIIQFYFSYAADFFFKLFIRYQ